MKKMISWNVNGLRACVGKGFLDVFHELDADIFCIQESKLQEGQIDLELPGYYQYWSYAEKKGYSGTALFSKEEPISVSYGLGIEKHDHEGRVITAEYPDYYVVTCYTPNSQNELARLPYRMQWEDDFRQFLKKLEEKKPVVFLDAGHGDFDPGKVSVDGSLEKDINLAIAKRLKRYLEQSDVEVVMSREDDRGLYDTSAGSRKMSDMKNRCARVEESGADLVVSIHQNSYHQEDVSGAQVFYYRKSEKGKRLAEILQKRFDYALGDQNRRKAKPNDSYYLLLHVKCPIVIVECGFLSNWKEAALLKTEEYQDRVAYTLHMGIMEYLNGR